ncbi:MAG: anti-sigma regulatory factor [Micromonosporaceae bacterium]
MAQALGQIRQTTDEDIVVLTVPAEGAYLSVLRTAAAGLAARLHFTLDEIEDLRIAVDEACAMLVGDAAPGTDLSCRFAVAEDALGVAVSVAVNGRPALPGTQTFAWTVLTALAGEVHAEHDGGRATIRLTKRRRTSP